MVKLLLHFVTLLLLPIPLLLTNQLDALVGGASLYTREIVFSGKPIPRPFPPIPPLPATNAILANQSVSSMWSDLFLQLFVCQFYSLSLPQCVHGLRLCYHPTAAREREREQRTIEFWKKRPNYWEETTDKTGDNERMEEEEKYGEWLTAATTISGTGRLTLFRYCPFLSMFTFEGVLSCVCVWLKIHSLSLFSPLRRCTLPLSDHVFHCIWLPPIIVCGHRTHSTLTYSSSTNVCEQLAKIYGNQFQWMWICNCGIYGVGRNGHPVQHLQSCMWSWHRIWNRPFRLRHKQHTSSSAKSAPPSSWSSQANPSPNRTILLL